MKSYQVCAWSAPLQLVERPDPEPRGSEVLLRVISAGICHTDLHVWDGYYDLGGGKKLQMADRGATLPLTLGHESVGEVVRLGPDARGVEVGDRRLVYPWIGCGECPACARGDENLCSAGTRPIGIVQPGGYSDHLLAPHPRYLFPIGDLPPDVAALLACSGVTTYSALRKVDPALLRRAPIVVIGAGGLGLMCLSLLRALGGRGAVVVDIDARKRQAALAAGALAAVDGALPDAAQRIQAAAGAPIPAVIDLVGAPATSELGMGCLAKGGKVISVGMFGGSASVPLPMLTLRALTLQGSIVGSLTELRELLDLVERTGVPALPITARPLAEVNAALAELRAGKLIGRTVLKAG